ncbi:MAG: hypothetical protein LBK98_07475 [Peptococcaceae bacterium]|nr:hypothetical protein [Peptococcaceae bacterium]
MGKFAPDHDGRSRLPVSVQARHAVCDGYHVGRFLERARALADKPEVWLC